MRSQLGFVSGMHRLTVAKINIAERHLEATRQGLTDFPTRTYTAGGQTRIGLLNTTYKMGAIIPRGALLTQIIFTASTAPASGSETATFGWAASNIRRYPGTNYSIEGPNADLDETADPNGLISLNGGQWRGDYYGRYAGQQPSNEVLIGKRFVQDVDVTVTFSQAVTARYGVLSDPKNPNGIFYLHIYHVVE